MNDSNAPAASPASNPASETGSFAIITQYIKDLSFENPHAPGIYAAVAKKAPSITVSVDVAAQKLQGRLAESVLKLRVDAKAEDKVCFILEVEYGALCSINTAAPREEAERYLLVDVARDLFPFLRQVVASQSREAGFQQLMLQPIDFNQLYEKRKADGALIRSDGSGAKAN